VGVHQYIRACRATLTLRFAQASGEWAMEVPQAHNEFARLFNVMPALVVTAIHVVRRGHQTFCRGYQDVVGRDKPFHDD
jgi:hypothetical protein